MFLTLIFKNVEAQKMYIWCPDQLNPVPRTEKFKNIEINILVNDTRLITEKTKNKCITEELTCSIFIIIKKSYPSATIIQVADNKKRLKTERYLLKLILQHIMLHSQAQCGMHKQTFLLK